MLSSDEIPHFYSTCKVFESEKMDKLDIIAATEP